MESIREQVADILESHRMYQDFDEPPLFLADKIISLITKKEPVAKSPTCNEGLEGRFFMERRVPHLLNIAEELLTWCIEEDKKGILKGLLRNYRKEYEDIIETAD